MSRSVYGFQVGQAIGTFLSPPLDLSSSGLSLPRVGQGITVNACAFAELNVCPPLPSILDALA